MNKLLLATIASAMLPLAVMAQYGDVYDFDPDKIYYVWSYYGSTSLETAFTEDYYLYDSFESNGNIYRMVLAEGDSKGGPPFTGGELTYMTGVRETDGRVLVDRGEYLGLMAEGMTWENLGDSQYIPYRQTGDELVLYDFNMNPGDKYPSFEGYEDISVVSKTIMITRDGVSRQLLTLSNGCKLLEGIGCLNSLGLLFFYLNPAQNPKDYQSYGLYQFVKRRGRNSNIEIVYQQGDEKTAGISEVKQAEFSAPTVYNLQGRRVNGTPRPGIYIREGRKVVNPH